MCSRVAREQGGEGILLWFGVGVFDYTWSTADLGGLRTCKERRYAFSGWKLRVETLGS